MVYAQLYSEMNLLIYYICTYIHQLKSVKLFYFTQIEH